MKRRVPGRKNVRKLTSAQRWTLRWHALKRVLRGSLAVALVLLSAYGGHLFYTWVITTPYLQVQGVNVQGNTQSQRWEVVAVAGQLIGVHQVDLDLDVVVDRVLQLPWVVKAEVSRVFPDQVQIDIVEREAVAVLLADSLYYIDAKGAPFLKADAKNLVDLPMITGLDDPSNMLRTKGVLGRGVLREALSLIDICEGSEAALGEVSEVHVSIENGLSVFLASGGSEILLGWDDYELKLDRLRRLREQQGLDLHQVAKVNLAMNKAAVVTALPTRVRRR